MSTYLIKKQEHFFFNSYQLSNVFAMLYLQKLLKAAEAGDIKDLRLCLENHADINYKGVSEKVAFKITLIKYTMQNYFNMRRIKVPLHVQ